MSLITHDELVNLVKASVIEGVAPDRINAASIDVTLGNTLWIEASPNGLNTVVDLIQKEAPAMTQIDLNRVGYYDLAPGQFCLAQTREVFNLPAGAESAHWHAPSISGEYKLKSSMARAGLGHLLAGWCDPGWHGSVLTLEFVNHLKYHSLRLRPGMRCGQIVLWRGEPVPQHASYANSGRYNNDLTATPSKGVGS
jgi:dCTP deaminase